MATDKGRETANEILFDAPARTHQVLPVGQDKPDPAATEPVEASADTGMSRAEALKERRRILKDRRKDEEATAQRNLYLEGLKLEATRAIQAVHSDGIFLNKYRLAELLAEKVSFQNDPPLPACVMGARREFQGWTMFKAEDIIRWVNGGACGTANMGCLSLIRIESLADLEGPRGRQLGYMPESLRSTRFSFNSGEFGIEAHFERATHVLGYARTPAQPQDVIDADARKEWENALPEGCLGVHAAAAWAAVDGRPHRGPVLSVRECVPFECLLAWASGAGDSPKRITAVRSLKYQPLAGAQVLANAAPVEVALDLGTGELLAWADHPYRESWRPRLADLGAFTITIDPLAMRILSIKPYAPEAGPAVEASAVAPDTVDDSATGVPGASEETDADGPEAA